MDLRIVTAVLIFLCLYLHVSAYDEHEKKHAKFIKHSGASTRRRNFHKVPVAKKINKTVSEKITKTDVPSLKIHRKMIVPTNKNKNFVEQTINSQEIIRKNEIEIVNSAESNSQIEEPTVENVKSDEFRKSGYEITKKEETLEEPTEIIKEIIIIRSVCDIKKLLANIGIVASGDVISPKEDQNVNHIDVPEESKKTVVELRNQMGSNSYQESEESLHEENIESRNMNQRKMKENEISGEEITRKHVITKENRKSGGGHTQLDEEIDEEYMYSEPNIIKKYIVVKNEEPTSEQIEIKKYNGNKDSEKSTASRRIQSHIISKSNISSKRKNNQQEGKIKEIKEEVVVPIENSKRRNGMAKSNKKIEEVIVQKNYNPTAREQLEDELIEDEISNYGSSNENIEVEEHIHTKNMNSEPESIEKYIFIEKHPSIHKYLVGEELLAEDSGIKYGIYTYPDERENEIVKDYIYVNNKSPSLRRIQESEEIIEKTYNKKPDKIC